MDTDIPCQVPDCPYVATHQNAQVAIAMLSSHNITHASAAVVGTPRGKAPAIERPMVGMDVSEETWENFASLWKQFKKVTFHVVKFFSSLKRK